MPVILVDKESPQISVVTLNRPERRNALTLELLTELCAAINVASEQPEQRILIFRGAGAAFCTGLDLKEAAEPNESARDRRNGGEHFGRDQPNAARHHCGSAWRCGRRRRGDNVGVRFCCRRGENKDRISRGAPRTGCRIGYDISAPPDRRTKHARAIV